MIFVTGPLFAGKRDYIRRALRLSEAELADRAVWDVQDLVRDPSASRMDLALLADTLARREIVIATETGGGIIPMDREERTARERAGQLACLLAARADTVIRVQCGLGMVLKGSLRNSAIQRQTAAKPDTAAPPHAGQGTGERNLPC